MTASPARRRHLTNSPFRPTVVPEVEEYACGDLVCHDTYGMGRVIGIEASAVTVDFRSSAQRIVSPFGKMSKL
ncbi:hypothetical protein [Flexivirga lutea]